MQRSVEWITNARIHTQASRNTVCMFVLQRHEAYKRACVCACMACMCAWATGADAVTGVDTDTVDADVDFSPTSGCGSVACSNKKVCH